MDTGPESASPRAADDLWRVIAAVGVVAIHAAGGFEAGWPHAPETWAAVLVSQWARFSVPLFMVFSGYGLACSERRRGIAGFDRARLAAFWRRRGLRIGLPYLLFTLAGLAWSDRLSGITAVASADLGDGLRTVGDALLRGRGDYHLYFLSFLLQGYLLWPLLRRPAWSTVIGLLAVQALFASPTHVIWPGRPHVPAWLIVHWAGYLALGARLARSTPRPPRGAGAAWLVTLGLLIAEYTAWATRLDAPGHYNHFARWVVIAYALATVWLWRGSAGRVAGWLTGREARVRRLAGLTFAVYLLHPWVLRAMASAPVTWGFAGRFAVAVPATFALAAGLDRLIRPVIARRLLGLG